MSFLFSKRSALIAAPLIGVIGSTGALRAGAVTPQSAIIIFASALLAGWALSRLMRGAMFALFGLPGLLLVLVVLLGGKQMFS